MAKKKAEDTLPADAIEHPFVGGEDDDLMDMEYIQNDATPPVDTHPPETEAEAAAWKETQESAEKARAEASEEEAEPEPEAEAEPEPEAEAEPEVEEDSPKVPKDRFDEVNERMKKAEKKAKELEKQLETVVEEKTPEPEPEPYDYAAKEAEAVEAILEGDSKKYAEIRSEIRTAERAETLREAQKLAETGDRQLRENMTFEEAGASIEAQYPQLDAESELYNEEAREEMLDLFLGYARSGAYTRVQALQKAAEKTAKIMDLGIPAPADTPDNVVNLKPTDVKKKVAASKNQPPSMQSKAPGELDEPKHDVRSMSDEEFESLPESAKRRMRGDIL